MSAPELYFDLASPYAYLAVERAPAVLGVEPIHEPILVGAIFRERGRGSWAHTPQRDANVAEIERRVREYGLPPIAWPRDWPANSLSAMRAAIWAARAGRTRAFARAAYRRAFVDGRDIADVAVLVDAAAEAGLPADELADAIADPEIKQALKDATARAWEAGVAGVPTVRVGTTTFYGDDRLDQAAAALAAA
jgi:2-hydroxychromene-2-carboxylate isomerase